MTLSTAEIGPQAGLGRKVLVAEDSSITQDLLKLLLNQRGHQVDIASDGLQALAALRKNQYDVALLDFHLPGLDGLQVAATIRSEGGGRRLPRFIAITADPEGLLAHDSNCENFDHILPKPLDIYQVGKVVEEQAEIADRGSEFRGARAPRLAMVTAEAPAFLQGLGHQFLMWPGDLEPNRISSRATQATLGDPRFDGIVINVVARPADLASIWRHRTLHLLPIIDMTGALGRAADLDGSQLKSRDTNQLDRLIERFQGQRARLHRDLVFSDDTGEKLLGRAFVSGNPLFAGYDLRSKTLVGYNTIPDFDVVTREAEALCGEGLFKREFFDRFHICIRCNSTRMNVREECSKCRSADITEESYLHHFRCAYQGRESEFRHGDDLICPKCRRELSNFGADYDRPGAMSLCRACGHADSEPAIGFVCLDCGAHAGSETTSTRDAYSYSLTDQGVGFSEYGSAFLGQARRSLRFAELPLELVVALNAAAKQFNDTGTPFTLANIFYQSEREIVADEGPRQFVQGRDLFIENLRAALSANDLVVRGQSYDFALLRGTSPEQARGEFDRLREAAQSTLRFDLGATFQAFGPADLS